MGASFVARVGSARRSRGFLIGKIDAGIDLGDYPSAWVEGWRGTFGRGESLVRPLVGAAPVPHSRPGP